MERPQLRTGTQIPRKEPQASLDYWEVKGIKSMWGITRWGLEMAGPQHDMATWRAPRNPSSGPETTVSSNGVTRWGEIGQGRFGGLLERYPKSSKSLDHFNTILVLKLVWGICTWRIIPLSKWLNMESNTWCFIPLGKWAVTRVPTRVSRSRVRVVFNGVRCPLTNWDEPPSRNGLTMS